MVENVEKRRASEGDRMNERCADLCINRRVTAYKKKNKLEQALLRLIKI